jgi:DNA polymerase-3 subunit gamma/tau
VAVVPAVSPDGRNQDDAWRAILERVRATRPALASVLEHALPLEVGVARVVVGFEAGDAFLAARASEPESLEALTREVRGYFEAPTQVALDLSATRQNKQRRARSIASIDAEKRSAEAAEARAKVEAHPVVQEAIHLFGAQLRDVKLPSGEA